MKNIKVNLKDKNGKRTSTTINITIVRFYINAVLNKNISNSENDHKAVKKIIQQFVDDNNYHNKDEVEFNLLVKIYEDGRQRGLILF